MNYYRHIDRSRVQFDFLVDEDSTLVPHEEIELMGGRVFELPPYQKPIRYQRALKRLFGSQEWAIIHSHINALSVFPLRAAKKAGIPVRISHSHSTAGKGEWGKNAIKAVLKSQANRYPTHRMACSAYAGDWLFGSNTEFEIIHNAIDLSMFAFNASFRAQTRASLGIEASQLVLGHVGRFVAQKNHAFLLDVFSEVLKRRPDAVLLLVGDGKQQDSIKAKAKSLGISRHVLFLGQRDDVDRLYQAFDVFMLPSLYEGLGIAAIEAQRADLPCLLSNRVPEEANVTGAALFLPIDNPAIWADAISGIDLEKRRRAAAVPGECFREYDINFEARKLTTRYEEMYAMATGH